jgi:hypothetical protein
MTEHCIIKADFASFRPVQGRKVLQLVLEVAIEEGDDALKKLGGMPRPGESRWCAIALLEPEAAKAEGQAEGGSPKKSWAEYPRSQQAAILCGDPDFWRYFICASEGDATKRLKEHFRISSRKELDDPQKHGLWDEFVALYNLYRARHG